MLCSFCGKQTSNPTSCISCGRSPLLEGQYALDEIVGRGASGVTYRARRVSDGATVAVKELSFRSLDSFKALDLFQREAKVLRQLRHPGIPAYLADFYVEEGKNLSFYLIQEFISGRTLAKEAESKRYSEPEALQIACEVLLILEYLHTLPSPVIHRDLKPQNIMRRAADHRLVLLDFGCVKDSLQESLQGGSTVAGTFGYMPPEQFQGRASPASDIYSLGAVLASLLAGVPADKLLNAQNQLQIERLQLRPEVRGLLSRMLEVDPEERYSSARELRHKIERLLANWDKPVSHPQVARSSRGSSLWFAVLGGLVALGGVTSVLFLSMKEASLSSTINGIKESVGVKSPAKLRVARDLSWFDGEAKPLAVDVNKDGVEDVIAIYAKPNQQGYVGALSGVDFTELWSLGPFGDTEVARGKIKVALAGERLLITDFQGNANLHEMRTGALVKSFPQDEVAREVCGAPPGESTVWINPPGLLIDGAKATTKPDRESIDRFGREAPWCKTSRNTDTARVYSDALYVEYSERKTFPRFDVKDFFEEAGETYALVQEKTGYQQYYLLKYKGDEILESISLHPFAPQKANIIPAGSEHSVGGFAIQDGRFLFMYKESSSRHYRFHVVSVDLVTKQKIFDVGVDFDSSLIPDNQNLITRSRIYLVDKPRMHIFDAKTGEYLAIFGKD